MHIRKQELELIRRKLQYYQSLSERLDNRLNAIMRKRDEMHIDEECASKITTLESIIDGLLNRNIDRPLLLDEYMYYKRKCDYLEGQSSDNAKRVESLSATIKEMQLTIDTLKENIAAHELETDLLRRRNVKIQSWIFDRIQENHWRF